MKMYCSLLTIRVYILFSLAFISATLSKLHPSKSCLYTQSTAFYYLPLIYYKFLATSFCLCYLFFSFKPFFFNHLSIHTQPTTLPPNPNPRKKNLTAPVPLRAGGGRRTGRGPKEEDHNECQHLERSQMVSIALTPVDIVQCLSYWNSQQH